MVFPPLAVPFSNLTWWCLTILIGVVDRFANLPFAHIDVPPPSHAFLVLYWLVLGGFTWIVHAEAPAKHIVRATCGAALVLAFVYIVPGIRAALDPRLHFDALDVGQADCLLVRAPGGHAMLVDGGGKLERVGNTVVAQPIGDRVATRTVMPFLLRHWVLHLDTVVLTHPHGDHAGGLPVILAREKVDALWDSAQLYSGPAYQRALEVVRDHHIVWHRALRGESFDLGSTAHVEILAPELPLITSTSSDINNNSVVLRVEFGRTAILLTGDAQAEAEARLLSHGGADLRAEILKVGHHGSAYSSTPEFLAVVHPKIAIISCGRHNVFGHPSPQTLAALHAAGAATYRTDVNGGVTLTVDGDHVKVRQQG
jgi:competence protein ComEC